jgi:predicted enzyme related to lactoylglutathione lyase
MTNQQTQSAQAAATPFDELAVHGKLSYFEIPALDREQSAAFYEAVFGWTIRRRDDGDRAFDAPGGVIGRWYADRPPLAESLTPFIYVHDIHETVSRITSNGGEVVKPPHAEGDLQVATFRDPAGNLLGIWERPG